MSAAERPVIALGTFDGVHAAHRALLAKARAAGGAHVTALTFDRIPGMILGKNNKSRQIVTIEDKVELLKRAGADKVEVLGFDEGLSSMTAEDFFNQVIIGRYNAGAIAVGYDYRFGKGGAGNAHLLEMLCAASGVRLILMGEMSMAGVRISSSEIRRRISLGLVKETGEMLGREHFLKAYARRGALEPDLAIELPPVGMRFYGRVRHTMPPYFEEAAYDSKFWIEEMEQGTVIRSEIDVPIGSDAAIYLTLGPCEKGC